MAAECMCTEAVRHLRVSQMLRTSMVVQVAVSPCLNCDTLCEVLIVDLTGEAVVTVLMRPDLPWSPFRQWLAKGGTLLKAE